MLANWLEIVECKDYIKDPRCRIPQPPLIVTVRFTSNKEERVYAEIQLRTIAMDFLGKFGA